jgi:hypothetical protein
MSFETFVLAAAFCFVAAGEDRSGAVDQPYRAEKPLEDTPSAGSHASLIEQALPHAVFLLEESGGFSAIDPEKISLFGGSTQWLSWTWNDFDISDPFFAGASAFRLPAPLLDTFGLRYAETVAETGVEGLLFETIPDRKDRKTPLTARASLTLPNLGDKAPGALAIADAFSGIHATKRFPIPPEERRTLTRRLLLDLSQGLELEAYYLRYAAEVDLGARRFLAFSNPEGEQSGTFVEPHLLVAGAAVLTPKDGAWAANFALEYRQRENLYAELRHSEAETLAHRSVTAFAGLEHGPLRASTTLKFLTFAHEDHQFTRELHDVDGEALEPYFPDGQVLAGHFDADYRSGIFFLRAGENLELSFPDYNSWTQPLAYDGMDLGRIDFRSNRSLRYSGDHRAGVVDRTELGPLGIDYSFWFTAAISANSSGENTLFLPDAGLKLGFELLREKPKSFRPFLLLAKIPLPIGLELGRTLDPNTLSGQVYAPGQTISYDRSGGASIDVSGSLKRANIYSGAVGARMWPADGWRLTLQGLARAYDDTYWLVSGSSPQNYLLRNYPYERPPFYMGFHLQLHRHTENFLFELSFATLNAIGRTPFGNGPTANDLGAIDRSTADPNNEIFGLANLDGDRAFLFKLLVGYRFFEGFWFSVLARQKDGQPFAFYDDEIENGRLSRTYTAHRGSPLKYSRPLAGPREDFQLEFSILASYTWHIGQVGLLTRLECMNILDLGNELAERATPAGRAGRAALELQIPRALILTQELRF